MVWLLLFEIALLVLLVSPIITGLAYTYYSSWINDNLLGYFVKLGGFELKKLGLTFCNGISIPQNGGGA